MRADAQYFGFTPGEPPVRRDPLFQTVESLALFVADHLAHASVAAAFRGLASDVDTLVECLVVSSSRRPRRA